MTNNMTIREQILMNLVQVIDPETGVDVLRMQLIEDLDVEEDTGTVTYVFRPSSPLCPLAHSLAVDIKHAVASVAGVKSQQITVAGYIRAEELNEIINQDDV